MKKIISVILLTLLISSCGFNPSKKNYSYLTDDKNEIIFENDKTKFTTGDLYKTLKQVSFSKIENEILLKIASKYDYDQEEIEKNAQETVDMYVEMGMGDMIDQYYGGKDEYKNYLVSQMKVEKLTDIYVNENYEQLVADNPSYKMEMASFNSEEEAQNVLNKVKEGSTFAQAAEEINGSEVSQQVYLDSDESLVLEVKDYLNNTDTMGMSRIITHSETTPTDTATTDEQTGENSEENVTKTYYLLNVISKNVDDYKDDYLSLLTSKQDTTTVKEYFFKTHNVKFYDQDLYELMSKNYEFLK